MQEHDERAVDAASSARQFENLRNVVQGHFGRYLLESKLCDETILPVLNEKAVQLVSHGSLKASSDLADMLYSLALLNYEACRYSPAAMLLEHALRLRSEYHAPNSELLPDLEMLVLAYNNTGKFEISETTANSWLRVAEDVYGSINSYVGKVVFCLAQIYRKQRRFIEAEECFVRSITIFGRAGELNSPDAFTTRVAYADFLRQFGRDDEALQLGVA